MKTDIKHTVDTAIKFVQQLYTNDKQKRSVKQPAYFTTVNFTGFPCHCITIIEELQMLTDETDKLCKLVRCWLLHHQLLLTICDKLVARGVKRLLQIPGMSPHGDYVPNHVEYDKKTFTALVNKVAKVPGIETTGLHAMFNWLSRIYNVAGF
jgi:hypothetical protein